MLAPITVSLLWLIRQCYNPKALTTMEKWLCPSSFLTSLWCGCCRDCLSVIPVPPIVSLRPALGCSALWNHQSCRSCWGICTFDRVDLYKILMMLCAGHSEKGCILEFLLQGSGDAMSGLQLGHDIESLYCIMAESNSSGSNCLGSTWPWWSQAV